MRVRPFAILSLIPMAVALSVCSPAETSTSRRGPPFIEVASPATAGITDPGLADEGTLTSTAPSRSESGSSAPGPSSRSLTLLFTGDVLIHVPVANSAVRHGQGSENHFDFSPMFEEIRPVLIAADLAICHLETPLDPDSRTISGFPRFSSPAEIAPALAAVGYDGCSTASNHSLDRGTEGVGDTIRILTEAGLRSAGTALRPEDQAGTLYELPGFTLGHGAYTYGFSSGTVPSDSPWLANTIHIDRILKDAAELRRRGADLVVTSLHWGTEYEVRPSTSQWGLAERLLASPDIDLLVGHHSHTVQPIVELDGELVLFSLGNLLSNQTAGCCTPNSEEGVLLLVRARYQGGRWAIGEVAHVPTWVDRRSGHIVRPALWEAEGPPHEERLREAAARTATVLSRYGVGSDGLSVPDAVRWILDAKRSPREWSLYIR